jgi:hypothetical protein
MRNARASWLTVAACAFALAYAGCASDLRSVQQRTATSEARHDLEDTEARLHQQKRELYASKGETARDCPNTCALVVNICGLADRICTIAARIPEDPGTGARGQDGRARCRKARAATKACGCADEPSLGCG